MPRRKPALAVAAVLAGAIPLAACSASANPSDTYAPNRTYTCCSAGDIDAIRHPGDIIVIHWIAAPSDPLTNGPVTTVALTAGFAGPFATVSGLKASAGPSTVEAPVIVTTDQVGNPPVSIITIPKSAAPGYYNLTTTVALDCNQISGGHIIQVTSSK